MPIRPTEGPAQGINHVLLIAGWACLGAGLWLLSLSLDRAIFLIPPFFIAALVLGFLAAIRNSRIGGMLLLLATVVVPVVLLLVDNAQPPSREPAVSRTPDVGRGLSEQADSTAPETRKTETWEVRLSAGKKKAEAKTRRPVQDDFTADAIARLRAAPSRVPPTPVRRAPSPIVIPPDLPDLAVLDNAPLRQRTTHDDPDRADDATATPQPDHDRPDAPDEFMAGLPFIGREVESVLDEPPVQENPTNAGVQVGGTHMITDETNMFGKAWLQNNSTSTVQNVPLLVLWFDTNANVIATSRAYVNTPGGIPRGQTLDFRITTHGDPRIAGYHYIVLP